MVKALNRVAEIIGSGLSRVQLDASVTPRRLAELATRCRCSIRARPRGGCWPWILILVVPGREAAGLGQLLERLGARYLAGRRAGRRPPRLRPVRRAAAVAGAARRRPRAGAAVPL